MSQRAVAQASVQAGRARIGVEDRYLALVLPALLLIGVGLGLSLIMAINLGVGGVEDADAGAVSAAVNAMQQIGGSLGPYPFNTIAASALAASLTDSAGSSPAR